MNATRSKNSFNAIKKLASRDYVMGILLMFCQNRVRNYACLPLLQNAPNPIRGDTK